MHAVLAHFAHLQGDKIRDAVLATLIASHGGSTKQVGAKIWIFDGGVLGSLTVGGCVDARVREEAVSVQASGHPRQITVALNEDDTAFGMGCAGTVDVLLVPVALGPDNPLVRALTTLQAALVARRRAVLVLPLETPEACCVLVEGKPGEDLEAPLAAAARRLFREEGGTALVREASLPTFLELYRPPPRLVVVGAAPIAAPLVRIGKQLGLHVALVESRAERATPAQYPEADALHVGIPSEICATLTLEQDDAVVLTAHDYKYEVPVLKALARSGAGYVGMVASRRRGRAVLDFVEAAGVDPSWLAGVHTPAGLDIGARTPAEIALSILAEIRAVQAARSGGPMQVQRSASIAG